MNTAQDLSTEDGSFRRLVPRHGWEQARLYPQAPGVGPLPIKGDGEIDEGAGRRWQELAFGKDQRHRMQAAYDFSKHRFELAAVKVRRKYGPGEQGDARCVQDRGKLCERLVCGESAAYGDVPTVQQRQAPDGAPTLVEPDQHVVFNELVGSRRATSRLEVGGAGGKLHGFGPQPPRDQPVGSYRARAQRHVDAFGHQVDQLGGADDLDFDIRVGAPKAEKEVTEQVGRRHGQAEATAGRILGLAHRVPCCFGGCHEISRVFHEELTRVGQSEFAGLPVDQLDLQILLELGQAPTQGGAGHAQGARRRRNAASIGNCDEVQKVVDLGHDATVRMDGLRLDNEQKSIPVCAHPQLYDLRTAAVTECPWFANLECAESDAARVTRRARGEPMTRTLPTLFLLGLAAGCSGDDTKDTDDTGTELVTVGAFENITALAFGDDGTLYVADSAVGTVTALTPPDATNPGAGTSYNLAKMDSGIAEVLGTTPANVRVKDLAVHPSTQEAYLAVGRVTGEDYAAGIVVVNQAGDVRLLDPELSGETLTIPVRADRRVLLLPRLPVSRPVVYRPRGLRKPADHRRNVQR